MSFKCLGIKTCAFLFFIFVLPSRDFAVMFVFIPDLLMLLFSPVFIAGFLVHYENDKPGCVGTDYTHSLSGRMACRSKYLTLTHYDSCITIVTVDNARSQEM